MRAVYLEQELVELHHLGRCGLATRGGAQRKHRLLRELERELFRKRQTDMAEAVLAKATGASQ